MDSLATELTQALTSVGPPLLAVMAFLETAFLTGFFVPAGVALLIASFLASEGALALPVVVTWAVAGALVGDSTGFWIGRRMGEVPMEEAGWFRRLVAAIDPRRLAVLRRTPAYSVSLARVIAFVRTLMPISAGRSELGYVRFLAYDAVGIVLWAVSYVSVGYLAGESWRLVSRMVGGFWAAVFILVIVIGSLGGYRARRRALRAADDASSERGADMISVGLTGNVASGKSTVARVWAEAGIPVLSADELARQVVEPGSDGLAAVVAAFGTECLAPDGGLDRELLRRRVFADDEARRKLESILHPRIAELRWAWMARQRKAGAPMVAYEIPLLFETGQQDQFDVIVLVHAPAEDRKRRLVEDRGLTGEEGDRMIEAQMPSFEKRALSHFVIENDGTVAELEASARETLDRLLRAGS